LRPKWTAALATLFLLGIGVAKLVDAREAAELLAEARHAAQIDQNARSARLFAQALDENPGLRRAVLREYADQLLYSGQAAKAVPLLHETLDDPAIAPHDAERARRTLFVLATGPGQIYFVYRRADPEIKRRRRWFYFYVFICVIMYAEYKNLLSRVANIKEWMKERAWKVTPRS